MSAPPVTLAIETSQRAGAVALLTADGVVRTEALPLERGSDGLQPAIDRVVRSAGLEPRAIEAVGVSVGPGGFTGLRIAITTTKMLACALGVRVVAVPSALVAAGSIADDEVPGASIVVALACKRDTFWYTPLRRDEDRWRPGAAAALVEATVAPLADIDAVIADRFLPETMRRRCAERDVPIIEPRFDVRACLRVALRMLDEDRTVDAMTLAPIYPRPPEAVTLWNARRR